MEFFVKNSWKTIFKKEKKLEYFFVIIFLLGRGGAGQDRTG